MVGIESASTELADLLADLWVELADDQQYYGSHLRSTANRRAIRESLIRHCVTDRVLVAWADLETHGPPNGRRAGEQSAPAPNVRQRGGSSQELVGFVMFTIETPTFEQEVTRGFVENLFVRPAWRDAGVGTALLEAAEGALGEAGVDVIALEVMAENDDARRFYREQGYEPYRVELETSVESDTHSKADE